MQACVSVVRVLIEDALSCLARRSLIVQLLTQAIDAGLDRTQALSVVLQRRFDVGHLIGEATDLGRERSYLVGYHPYSLNRFVDIVSYVGIVVVFDLFVG